MLSLAFNTRAHKPLIKEGFLTHSVDGGCSHLPQTCLFIQQMKESTVLGLYLLAGGPLFFAVAGLISSGQIWSQCNFAQLNSRQA